MADTQDNGVLSSSNATRYQSEEAWLLLWWLVARLPTADWEISVGIFNFGGFSTLIDIGPTQMTNGQTRLARHCITVTFKMYILLFLQKFRSTVCWLNYDKWRTMIETILLCAAIKKEKI
jgi:hypothetical protein